MVELADTLDLGSNGIAVQVQVLLPAPQKGQFVFRRIGLLHEVRFGHGKRCIVELLRKALIVVTICNIIGLGMMLMKILYTAFKGTHNTSFQLVDQTGAHYVLLTNSFQGLKKDISSIGSDYDAVYMFGVDKHLTGKIRIELCAKNNLETVTTDFDLSQLEVQLKAKEISCTVSNQPTSYLCNAAYCHMLKKNPNTVFIHIPSLRGMTTEMMQKLIAIFRNVYFV